MEMLETFSGSTARTELCCQPVPAVEKVGLVSKELLTEFCMALVQHKCLCEVIMEMNK